MSNPFTRGSLTSFPASGNFVAMPNATAYGLGVVSGVTGVGAPYADIYVAPIQFKTGTGSLPNGYVSLYGICSEDNTHWDGTVNPSTSGTNQAAAVTQVNGPKLIQTLNTPATGTIYSFNQFSVWSTFGFIPSFFAVVPLNESGGTLDVSGSNFFAEYDLDSYN